MGSRTEGYQPEAATVREVTRALVVIIAVLAGLSALQDFVRFAFFDGGLPAGWGYLLTFFDVDSEANLPTWFSVVLAAAGGALSLFLRKGPAERRPWGWVVIAVALFAVSLDDMVMAHEQLVEPVRDLLGITSGPLYFAWVVPGALGVILFLSVLVSFLRQLRRETRRRVLVAGAVFVAGALVLEMVGAVIASTLGPVALWDVVTTVEEVLEMLGLTLFLRALLLHRATFAPGWSDARREMSPLRR